MRPSVLLLDPVRNLNVVGWMDLPTITLRGEIVIEEREGQPRTTRPKTMKRLVSPDSPGELCPPPI